MAARLLTFTIPLLTFVALACGGGSDGPGATSTPTATQQPTVPEALRDFSITLERTDCLGTCPSYTVSIDGDGSVSYEGRYFVAVAGTQTAAVSTADVQRLLDAVDDMDFFALAVPTVDGPEVCSMTDAPGYAVTVSLDGQRREIAHCPYSTADALTGLEELIDEVAGTGRWIEPNASTFSISLERTFCFGACPDYMVSIDGDGAVRYEGRSSVVVEGIQTDSIEDPGLQYLMHMVRSADFFELADYPCTVIDVPSYTTTVHLDGRTRTLSHCNWPQGSVPAELTRLENLIDEYADTARWVKGQSSREN